MKRILTRLHKDQRGTSLTEFIMTVPIFIVMFAGIMELGLSNEMSVRVWVNAYRDTFDQAYQVQTAIADPRISPTVGGGIALANINRMSSNRVGPLQRAIVLASDGVTFGNLATNGTMGESYWRNRASDFIFTQYSSSDGVYLMEGIQTSDITDMTGGSQYARDLLDDGPSAPNFSGGGGGRLSAVNALLTASGIRPAIATGVRYGTVTGMDTDSRTLMSFTYNYDAYFTTLVAPASPINIYGGEDAAEGIATAITRLTMDSYAPYNNMLGIQIFGGGLSGSSITVPCPAYPHFLDCP